MISTQIKLALFSNEPSNKKIHIPSSLEKRWLTPQQGRKKVETGIVEIYSCIISYFIDVR